MNTVIVGALSVVVALFASFSVFKGSFVSKPKDMVASVPQIQATTSAVLGDTTDANNDVINFNIDTVYNSLVTANKGMMVNGVSNFSGAINGVSLDLGRGGVTAGNIIYSVKPGSGVGITAGQDPIISNTGVLSLGGSTGVVNLEAGGGISIDGTKITNSDRGSDVKSFKTINITGQDGFSAGSSTDSFTFTAGNGITLTSDAANKIITLGGVGSQLNVSGLERNNISGYVGLTNIGDYLGIGTTTPTTKLHVVGAATITGGLNNSNGGITNAGTILGATGLTSSGLITFSGLTTGIVHSDFNGLLTSSAIDLSGSDVTGALSMLRGGTGISAYSKGDMLYASDTNVLSRLGAGGEGEILTIDNYGLPNWGSITNPEGLCPHCVVDNPNSTQTIVSQQFDAIPLSIAASASQAADLFKITNNGGSVVYFSVSAAGNVTLGDNTSSGNFTVAPANTDGIAINPVAKGALSYTGGITSRDLTDNRTWTFPDATGDICLSTGNCAGIQGVIGGSGTDGYITRWNGLYTVTNSVLFESGGNVGIGTTAPGSKLHVAGTATVDSTATIGGTMRVSGATVLLSTLDVSGNTQVNGTFGVVGDTTFSSNASVTGKLGVGYNSTDVTGAVAAFNGNVGIGLTNPNATLEVMSASAANASGQKVLSLGGNISSSTIGSGPYLAFTNTSSAERGKIGNVTESVTDVGLAFSTFSSSLSEKLRITGAGNVGIGVTNPSAKLQVLGTMEQLRLNYDASNYTSLTVNSTGGLSWSSNGTNIVNFGVANTSFETPVAFNATGDVSVGYDLVFNNQMNSFIKSSAPLTIDTGESWESNDLTLRTYNNGYVVVDSGVLLTNYGATVSSQLVIGTNTAPANIGNFYLTNSSTFGKALAILNQNEGADIFTASASGVTKFVINSAGNVGVGTANPGASLQIGDSGVAGSGGDLAVNHILSNGRSVPRISLGLASLSFDSAGSGHGLSINSGYTGDSAAFVDIIANSSSAMRILGSGNVGIGTTSPTSKFHVSGSTLGKALTMIDETSDQALLTASASGVTKVTINHNGLINATAGGLATYTKAGTISDTDFTDTAVDGLMGIDTTNHRIYFREGGSWSYAAKAGGFQIPSYESAGLAQGDFLVPYVESMMNDGAVHGLYSKLSDVTLKMVKVDEFVANKALIIGPAEFQGNVMFKALAEFFDNVVFHKDAKFIGRATFNKNMGGKATITMGTDHVDVVFENPYEVPPIVTISMLIDDPTDKTFISDGSGAFVTGVTKDRFSIYMPYSALRNFSYNWMAMAIDGPTETKSVSVLENGLAQVLGEATSSASTNDATPSASLNIDLISTGSGSVATPSGGM